MPAALARQAAGAERIQTGHWYAPTGRSGALTKAAVKVDKGDVGGGNGVRAMRLRAALRTESNVAAACAGGQSLRMEYILLQNPVVGPFNYTGELRRAANHQFRLADRGILVNHPVRGARSIGSLRVASSDRWLLRYYGKDNSGWMRRIMIDGVPRDATDALLTQRFARVGVDVKAGKVTAGDIEPDPVPTSKNQGSWIHLDREFGWLSWNQRFRVFERLAITRANNTVAYVEIDSSRVIAIGWINIDQLGGKIGIGAVGRCPELHNQTTGYLHILLQRRGLVHQDVRTGRQGQRVLALPID